MGKTQKGAAKASSAFGFFEYENKESRHASASSA
jgi:hypothetical protein